MSKVEEILQAVGALGHQNDVALRQALDEMDKAEWEAERRKRPENGRRRA